MIIGKDKLKFKELEEENENLKRQIQTFLPMQTREVNKDLLNIIKAILYHCKDNEIIIDEKDIEVAQRGEIYITDDIMRFAKRIKLMFKDNRLKEN